MNVTITLIFLSNLFFYPKKKRMTVTEEVTLRITISPHICLPLWPSTPIKAIGSRSKSN
ncbi:hypothetical protein NC652_000589 [Populus alba x Populus x berolinensis]|nr:hypothetical protein NC652_000589 [Populus alba x Populus x berolinensis]